MRKLNSKLPLSALRTITQGALRYTYKGILCQKYPFDIALYLKLLYETRPRTLIEIGSHSGGSALWFADMLSAYEVDAHVYSVDVKPVTNVKHKRVTFLKGDALRLEETFGNEWLQAAPRPLMVIEDSAHTFEVTRAVLCFFRSQLEIGEYLIVEDGIVGDFPVLAKAFDNGPNRAIVDFLKDYGQEFIVDTDYCDYYGYNFTSNTNGYLKKIA